MKSNKIETPFPEQYLKRLKAEYGTEADDFINAISQQPKTSIYLNRQKPPPIDYFEGSVVPWCSNGYILRNRPSFIADPLWHAGSYYVQEASSMIVSEIIKQLKVSDDPIRALDLCAAPGGKSLHLLDSLPANSVVVSNEVIASRVGILQENITKWCAPNCIITSSDPKNFSSLTNMFDLVLIDAPCSGEGLFRKDEESISRWSEENVNLCSARQKRILADIMPALKEEGYLLYSTCTFSKEENERNIEWLANNYPIEAVDFDFPENWGISDRHFKVGNQSFSGYYFFPHKSIGEGLFFSVIKVKGNNKNCANIYTPIKRNLQSISTSRLNVLKEWIEIPETHAFIVHSDEIYLISDSAFQSINLLDGRIRIIQTGVPLGSFKKDDFIPNHGLAMCSNQSNKISYVELPYELAVKFLRKDNFTLSTDEKGWMLMQYKGQNLGWIKNLGNRFNNYFPKNLRIRKEI